MDAGIIHCTLFLPLVALSKMACSSFGARVCRLFYIHNSPINKNYTFRCGIPRRKSGSSYENLLSHVWSAHPGFKKLLQSDRDPKQKKIDSYFKFTKAANYFGWYDLIVNGLLLLSYVEKDVLRETQNILLCS